MADANSYDSVERPNEAAGLENEVVFSFGLKTATSDPGSPVVCCLIRDGSYWLPSFLEHYRKAGVEEFFFLDNGSTDATLDILENEPDVGVYSADSRYFKKFNRHLRRIIVQRVRTSGWVLGVDIDEYFDYPYSDEISLRNLCRYLDDQQYNTVSTHMLDMLPDSTIGKLAESEITDPRILCPYYSLDGLVRTDYSSLGEIFKGYPASSMILPEPGWGFFCDGIRKKVFGVGLWLTKHALFKLGGDLVPYHHAHIHRNARIANVSAVLYHYKFSPRFESQVRNALVERQYCDDSYDYDCYDRTMRERGEITLRDHTAKRLESVHELLNQSFLQAPYYFRSWFKSA